MILRLGPYYTQVRVRIDEGWGYKIESKLALRGDLKVRAGLHSG